MAVIVRMQAVIPFASGLPSDVITNTLYFHDLSVNTDVEVVADAVNPSVQAFYDAIYDNAVPNYLATANLWEARYYSVGTPPPNIPYILPLVATGPPSFTPTNIPTEVACVLSFQGDVSQGAPQARRRGRIYLGGLSDTNLLSSTSAPGVQFPRFNPTWISNVVSAAIILENTQPLWVVYSPTNNATTPVTNGWVDNAPDTQRRRGVDATERTLWS